VEGALANAPAPLIARSGRRFVQQKRRWRVSSVLLTVMGFTAYFVAYFVPIVLIFAAVLTITDGRP
jgi:hypothetical protein